MSIDTKSSILKIENNLSASASTLFDAFTNATIAELWLFSSAKVDLNFFADVKKGGEFRLEELANNQVIIYSGTYRLLQRPNKLEFSLEMPSRYDGSSEVSVEIIESRGGTKLILTQECIDPSITEKLWRDSFEKLKLLLEKPYTVNTKSPMNEVLDAIDIVAMQLAGFASLLSNEELNTVPFKGSWTVGQVLRHVNLSIGGLGQAMSQKNAIANRDIFQQIVAFKQVLLDFTKRLQSPEMIIPENKQYDKDRLLEDQQRFLKQLRAGTSTSDPAELVEGMPFGPVTKLELIHFLLYHTQRHLVQMKKVCDLLEVAG